MYLNLLTVHSLFRWCVLISVVTLLIRSLYALKFNELYTVYDKIIRRVTVSILYIQMMLGLWLYFISPFVKQFMNSPKTGLHLREVRFFAMEHGLMMLVAVIIVTIGSIKAKSLANDNKKHKTVFKWYLIALIIILLNIPWEFSPLVHRPSFRWF